MTAITATKANTLLKDKLDKAFYIVIYYFYIKKTNNDKEIKETDNLKYNASAGPDIIKTKIIKKQH